MFYGYGKVLKCGHAKWIVLGFSIISEEEVGAEIKWLNIGKTSGHTGVVSEMMKTFSGLGTRWKTALINNIVIQVCTPDEWRQYALVPVYKGKCDPLVRKQCKR